MCGADFSYLPEKYNFTDIYYLPFTFTTSQNKEFKIHMCFSAVPDEVILYFGTGSTAIKLSFSGAAWAITTDELGLSGDYGRIAKNISKTGDSVPFTFTGETAFGIPEMGGNYYCGGSVGTAEKTKFIENGTIRSTVECRNDTTWHSRNRFYYNTQWWGQEIFADGNYSGSFVSMTPEGIIGDSVDAIVGDGSVDGLEIGDGGNAQIAVQEGWVCFVAPETAVRNESFCVYWDINKTCPVAYNPRVARLDSYSRGGLIFIEGGASNSFPANCVLDSRASILDSADPVAMRQQWNTSFRKTSVVIVNNTGNTLIQHSAQELKCIPNSTNLGRCEATITYAQHTLVNTTTGNPDVVYFNAENLTGSNVYVYLNTNSSILLESNLVTHACHNSTAWVYCTLDTYEANGTGLDNPSNSTMNLQICDSDTSACNTMDSSEHKVLFMAEGFRTYPTQRLLVSNHTITDAPSNSAPSIASPVFNTYTVTNLTDLNCSANPYISDSNGDNMTVFFNFTRSGTNILNYILYNQTNGSSPSFVIEHSNFSKNQNVSCEITLFDGIDLSLKNVTSVNISNSNPLFEKISNFTKDEDFVQFQILLGANISDIDSPDSLLNITYILNDTSIFTLSINNVTDELTFTSIANQYGSVDVTLIVFDDEGASNTTNFMLTVNNVNEPSVENIVFRTDGGFTTSPLIFSQYIDIINATCNGTDRALVNCTLTVADPDRALVVDTQLMSNTTYYSFYYDTDFLLNKIGTWTINVTATDIDNGKNMSTTSFVVNSNNLSLIDGWYGYSNKAYILSPSIMGLVYYGFDLFELETDASNISSDWPYILQSINDSKQVNIRSGLKIDLAYNFSNDTRRDELMQGISNNISDLSNAPYNQAFEYILLNLVNQSDYADGILASVCNNISKNVTQAITNDYVIYCSYNSSNLDSSYVQYNKMLYIEADTSKSLIDILARTMRTNSSLNRIFVANGTSMNSTLLNISRNYNIEILEKVSSTVNSSTLIADGLVAELNNGDLIVFNNDSVERSRIINFSLSIDVNGKDLWDYTNHLLIGRDVGLLVNVTVAAHSFVLVATENLDHLSPTTQSGTTWTAYLQNQDSVGNANYYDGVAAGNWPVTALQYARIRLYDPNYKMQGVDNSKFLVYYGWLNASDTGTGKLTNPEGFDPYNIIIIADKNQAELTKLINNTDGTNREVYGYISVNDYDADDPSWIIGKKSEVDAWLDMNSSMNIFVNGLDYAVGVNTTQFPIDMKNLTDYIKITKDRKLILNVYTQYEVFAQWGDYTMKESCINRWNGADSTNPTNYSRETWSLDYNKSIWYKNHNVEVLCMAFSNTTNQTDRMDIFIGAKALGYKYIYISDPTFNDVYFDYMPDFGTDLANEPTKTGTKYTRKYSNGIITYNSTTGIGEFDNGRSVNLVNFSVYVYGEAGRYVNVTINDKYPYGQGKANVYRIGNPFNYMPNWQGVVINGSDIPEYGLYEMTLWGNGVTIYWDNPIGRNRNSYYSDNSGLDWTIYDKDKNWYVNLFINETTKSSIDTTTRISQVNGTRDGSYIYFNISANDEFNITTYSKYFEHSGYYQSLQVKNTSGWQNLTALNSSICSGANPSFNTDTIGTDSIGSCYTNENGNFLVKVSVPKLSTWEFRVDANTAPTTPNITQPTNLSLTSNGTIEWSASTDAESDPITYILYAARDIAFSVIEYAITSISDLYHIFAGGDGTWFIHILATDGSENSTWSGTINFTLDTTPPSVTNVKFYAINGSGNVIGGADYFNTNNLTEIEKMQINFTLTDSGAINGGIIFYFTANGTNGCSLGNKQSSICYNNSNGKWIEMINGSETSTFKDEGLQGDYIDVNYIGNSTQRHYTITIDEHYNPNVFKWYDAGFDFNAVKWQTGTEQRITKNNQIKIQINMSLIPLDFDQAKVDFRVNTSSNEPVNPMVYYACNSSYSNGDVEASQSCSLLASYLPSELRDDGTKSRSIITKSLIDTLGDFKYIVIKTDEANPNRYYALKTINATTAGYETHWEYSTNNGVTWANLGDGYETELNINWFYAATNPTGFVFKIFSNDSLNNGVNSSEYNLTWNIDSTQNYRPIVNILSPAVNSTKSGLIAINWSTAEPNGDSYLTNVSVTNVTSIISIASDLGDTTSNFVWDSTSYNGWWNLTISSCENATSEKLCGNSTHLIFLDNIAPSIFLESPANDSSQVAGTITFKYYVNETNGVSNCTLDTGSISNVTNSSIQANVANLTFQKSLAAGLYNWKIYCTDSANNINVSESRSLTLTTGPSSDTGGGGGGGGIIENFNRVELSVPEVWHYGITNITIRAYDNENKTIMPYLINAKFFNGSIESYNFIIMSKEYGVVESLLQVKPTSLAKGKYSINVSVGYDTNYIEESSYFEVKERIFEGLDIFPDFGNKTDGPIGNLITGLPFLKRTPWTRQDKINAIWVVLGIIFVIAIIVGIILVTKRLKK